MKRLLAVAAVLLVSSSLALAQDAPKKEAPKNDEASIKKRLESLRLNVNFDETPLSEAVAFLQDLTGLNILIDSAVAHDTKVTFQVKDCSAEDLVAKLCAKTKLSHEIWKGCVWLGTKETFKNKPAAKLDAKLAQKFSRMTLNGLNLDETSFAETLVLLEDLSEVTFKASKAIDAEALALTLKLAGLKFGEAIDIICRLTGFRAESKDGAVVFAPPPEEK